VRNAGRQEFPEGEVTAKTSSKLKMSPMLKIVAMEWMSGSVMSIVNGNANKPGRVAS
jgi:hypothetical protein